MRTKTIYPSPPSDGARPVKGKVARWWQDGGIPDGVDEDAVMAARDTSKYGPDGDVVAPPFVWESGVVTTGWGVAMLRLAGWNVQQIINVAMDLNNKGGAWLRWRNEACVGDGLGIVKRWCAEPLRERSTDESKPKRKRRKTRKKEWEPVAETSKAKFLLWVHESGPLSSRALYEYPDWKGRNAKGVVDQMKKDLVERGHLLAEVAHRGARGRPPMVHRATGSGVVWARAQVEDSQRQAAAHREWVEAVKQHEKAKRKWKKARSYDVPYPRGPRYVDGHVVWPLTEQEEKWLAEDERQRSEWAEMDLFEGLLGDKDTPEVEATPKAKPLQDDLDRLLDGDLHAVDSSRRTDNPGPG